MSSVQHTKIPTFDIEFDREVDGRWIAEVPKLPGVMAYGYTKQEARRNVYAIEVNALTKKAVAAESVSHLCL